MTISRTNEGGAIILAVEGRLDTRTSPQFQEALIPLFDEVKEVRIDCADVVYVSSAGLRVLLMGAKTAKAKGTTMTLINVSEDVMNVLEITGFAGILTIE